MIFCDDLRDSLGALPSSAFTVMSPPIISSRSGLMDGEWDGDSDMRLDLGAGALSPAESGCGFSSVMAADDDLELRVEPLTLFSAMFISFTSKVRLLAGFSSRWPDMVR